MAAPDPSDVPSPGWWAGLGTFLVAAGAAVGILRGVRKDARQSAADKARALEQLIDARAEARIEELVTPQVEELKTQIRELGDDLSKQLRDSDQRRSAIEQEHHTQNLERLATLDERVEGLRERRRAPRGD